MAHALYQGGHSLPVLRHELIVLRAQLVALHSRWGKGSTARRGGSSTVACQPQQPILALEAHSIFLALCTRYMAPFQTRG